MNNKNKFKRRALSVALGIAVSASVLSGPVFADIKPVNDIRVNQHGYLPNQPKVAVYLGPANASWELRKSNGTVVASGQTTAYGFDKASGDTLSRIDFSSYTGSAKNLTLHIGSSKSYPFDISAFTYKAMKEDAMTYFYHQRFGSPVLAELVGEEFAREAGHLMDSNLQCDDNLPSDWDSSSYCTYSLDVRGGHQDAGDYGGYVTNGGYYTWLLQYVYESLPSAYPDGSLPIPERGNGIPDILDEARYELDFIMRMQVPQNKSPYPGMLHHKKSWQAWAPFPLVPADDNGVYWGNPASKRTIKPVSTSATLNGAAVMAQASRIWKNFPGAAGFDGSSTPYHETLITRAEIAWDAAVANPALYASSDASMGSGPYNDNTLSDEFYWAAAELYLTTKKSKYKTFLLNSPHFAKYNAFDWQVTNVGGNLSLVLHDADSGLTTTEKNQLKAGLKNYADATVTTMSNEGYLAPIAPRAGGPTQGTCSGTYNYTYPWGAVGSFMLSNGVQLAAAHKLTGDSKYINGVTQTMDHVLGTNALDRAYMTGYGENPTTEPHHRFWLKSKGNPVTAVAEAVSVPYPAAVAGGPQNELVEDGTSGPETDGTPCAAPAKSYADHWNNYSSNEITVNWNANLAAVLAFIDDAIPSPNDTSAPSAPAGLTPVATSGSSIKVSWNVAADNSRIRHYNVFMKPNGGSYSLRGTTKSTSYDVVPLQPGTQYCFKVSAQDYAGLVSPQSAESCVNTNAPNKFEIYYQPDNSAMSDYVGTGAVNAPEAPTAVLGKGWYQYQFHTNGPRFDFHFSMPNWGSPQRFSPDGTGTNWKIYDTDFSADGVIWLTADKQFHKTPPNVVIVDPGCEPNCEVPNVAPTATSQSVNVAHNTVKTITLAGSDSDGTIVSFAIEQNPAHGSVTLSGNTATYTPNVGYAGSDNFKFSVLDNDGARSPNATVSITVAPAEVANVAPTASNQSVSTNENQSKTITLAGTDSDGTIVSYRIEQQPANGSVSLSGNVATYVPNNGFAGSDSFTFSVLDDDNARSTHATVSITVNAIVVPAGDELCTVADTSWSAAQSKFASECSAFTRDSCESVSVGSANWVMCSSLPNASNYLPVVNGVNTATIQAEDYARAIDTSTGNTGGAYRAGDVDIATTNDGGSGYTVGWISNGEQLHFDVLVTKATSYKMSVRTSSPNSSRSLKVKVNGATLASNVALPNTGSWGAYQTTTFDLGNLSVGSQVITIEAASSGFNLNWFALVQTSDSTGPTDPGTCLQYTGNARTELDISTTKCVDLPVNLSGKTLQVWDSDTNPSCDFRGSVVSVNGNGTLAIDSNYESSTALTGTRIKFEGTCDFVKMRVY